MFYIRFLAAELRRRPGGTALTALGLAIGVGLVVVVSALSAGLDDAQDKALAPLTGVGADMRVTRPLKLSGEGGGADAFTSLSDAERGRLLKENPKGLFHFDPAELGEPGDAFAENQMISSELSFPASEVRRISRLEGAMDAAAALSLQAVRIEGEVPAPGTVVNPHAGGYDIDGAVLQMVAHGLVTATLFFIAGFLKERAGTRDLGSWAGCCARCRGTAASSR